MGKERQRSDRKKRREPFVREIADSRPTDQQIGQGILDRVPGALNF